MNRVAASVVAFTALTMGVAMGTAGGAFAAEKFVIALPNGYEMVRAKSGEPSIVKRKGSVAVPAPIKAFAVVRDVVTGEMLTPGAEIAPPAPPATPIAAAPAAAPSAAPAGAASAPVAAPTAAPPAAAPAASAPAAPASSSQAAAPAPGASPTAAPGGASPGTGAPPAGGRRPAAPVADTGSPVFTRPPPNPNSRYFVLDTRTGEVSNNLSVQDWEAQLKKLDIASTPELAPPILPK